MTTNIKKIGRTPIKQETMEVLSQYNFNGIKTYEDLYEYAVKNEFPFSELLSDSAYSSIQRVCDGFTTFEETDPDYDTVLQNEIVSNPDFKDVLGEIYCRAIDIRTESAFFRVKTAEINDNQFDLVLLLALIRSYNMY